MFQRYFLAPLAAPLLLAATPQLAQAQTGAVGIGTTAPDASAALHVTSTSQGLLPPRLTQTARLAMGTGSVPAPAPGLLVYQTDGTAPGFYYASSATTWVRLTDAAPADSRYIQNQTAAAQSGGFRVSGSGTVGGTLVAGSNMQVPAANAYRYAAPKAYSMTYAASDFQPETNAATSDGLTGAASGSQRLSVSVGRGLLQRDGLP
jgi:hypothetical protein